MEEELEQSTCAVGGHQLDCRCHIPLQIRVAEALGWFNIEKPNPMNLANEYIGYPPHTQIIGHKQPVPKFNEDWAAVGPLIEKFKIDLWHLPQFIRDLSIHPEIEWRATCEQTHHCMEGKTPFEAICKLVLLIYKEQQVNN